MRPTTMDVYLVVVRLEGKVDGVVSTVGVLTTTVNDHEKRIRGLEALRWAVLGLAAVVSVLAPFAVTWH